MGAPVRGRSGRRSGWLLQDDCNKVVGCRPGIGGSVPATRHPTSPTTSRSDHVHVPDGFFDAPTSVATGVVAAAGVAVALRMSRRELDDRTAPMAGLVATFI